MTNFTPTPAEALGAREMNAIVTWKNRTMTARQLKAAIKGLGMTQAGAARFVGVSERTMRRMIAAEVDVHVSIVLLLRLMIYTNQKPVVPEWTRDQT
jgi:DNA-binding XRE family transcriptional regulator